MNEIPVNLNPLQRCPSCGESTNVVKIVYGKPNEELLEKSKNDLCILGAAALMPLYGIAQSVARNLRCKK